MERKNGEREPCKDGNFIPVLSNLRVRDVGFSFKLFIVNCGSLKHVFMKSLYRFLFLKISVLNQGCCGVCLCCSVKLNLKVRQANTP